SFKDPSEWGVHQGVYDLNFVIDEVENTENKTIEWTVDGDPSSFEVTVRTPGDEQENVNDWVNKDAGGANFNQYVTVDEDGSVTVDAGIVNESINYTLTVHTPSGVDRSSFTITDELSEYLSYNNDFQAELTTWDENGWN